MQIGDYKLHSIQTGLFKLDGGAMFGVVPKPLWEKTNPADSQNKIEMCTRALLLVSKDKKIIIDTGIGYKLSDKLNKIYDVDYSQYTLEKSLQEKGFSNEDITDVIITHLHFDHAGGNTILKDEQLQPAFPNATYHVQERHLSWALNPTERDKASFFPANYEILDEMKILNKVDGDFEFDKNIKLLSVMGHTPFMQLIRISDGEKNLLYLADLIPTAGHIPVPYIMGYDLFPLTTLDEKKFYLKEIKKNNWMVFFEHDPHTECAFIGSNDKGYFVKEKFKLDDFE